MLMVIAYDKILTRKSKGSKCSMIPVTHTPSALGRYERTGDRFIFPPEKNEIIDKIYKTMFLRILGIRE